MFKKRLTMQISTNLRRIALFFLSMVLSSSIIFAQEKTITGKVTAEGEGPLPGVNVTVQGTTTGAITDLNGGYSIKVPGTASVLLFSSVGYTSKQVVVGTQNVIDMILESDVTALSEVVVTGYTSQRRKDLTGSVGTVESSKLTAVPTTNVSNALQGRSSGLTVTGNGQPGSTASVRIRGFSSLQNNDPLYVVDGVPTQSISSMNPGDVESISVLKDAGAASIYGSRASNGVIIVTTKKGGKGVKVTYSGYVGISDPGKGPTNLLNSQEYANLQWLVYKNDKTAAYTAEGVAVNHAIYGFIGNDSPTMPTWAANTNWYKEMTRTAMKQNHDISLSGGNDNSKFFAAIGVNKDEGIVLYSFEDKYSARFNSEFNFLNNRVKVGENFSFNYVQNNTVTNLGEASPIQMGSYRSQPIIPVVITEPITGISHSFVPGEWGGTGIANSLGQASNEVAVLTRDKDDKYWNINLLGSAFADVKIMQGLNFRSTIGGTWFNDYRTDYTYATYENSENTATPTYREDASYTMQWTWSNTLTFDKTFGQHKILVVAGYESNKYDLHRDFHAIASGYFTDDPNYRTITNGSKITEAQSNYRTPTTLLSQFARADYSFKDRYMLSATVRRDGSSKFGADNRYGVFPSFSGAWRISDEPFFKGISFINDLKLRGSWGMMGNQLAVDAANQYYTYGGEQNTSYYDINGTYTSSVQGFRPTRIGNPDAKWETNITTDFGFETTVLNNKIGFKFDVYNKHTKDLLYNPELPGTSGAATQPYINIASMTNKGFDVELSFKDKWGDFGFDGSAVISHYKNNIEKIADGVDFFDEDGGSRIGSFNRNMVGHPMSAFYGYKVIGLFQEDEFHDVTKTGVTSTVQNDDVPIQDGAEAGFFKYQDTKSDDGKITSEDRVFIGDPNPKFTYGINLAFTYKNFDLTAFLQGSQGNDVYNYNKWWTDFWPSFQGQKSEDLLYNSWTSTNTTATVPKASNKSNFSTNTQSTSYYIEDGSYLRMKNLQLGYTIPESLVSKISVKSLRVYLQVVNAFTITKYTGLDPEIDTQDSQVSGNAYVRNDRIRGVDYGNYPTVRQYIFGLNVSF
jgi:TonB-linked SusC/RagA family outer membrane protein